MSQIFILVLFLSSIPLSESYKLSTKSKLKTQQPPDPIQLNEYGNRAENFEDTFLNPRPTPMYYEDFRIFEQITNFDRENTAPRKVYSKGTGAFGYFEVTAVYPDQNWTVPVKIGLK